MYVAAIQTGGEGLHRAAHIAASLFAILEGVRFKRTQEVAGTPPNKYALQRHVFTVYKNVYKQIKVYRNA